MVVLRTFLTPFGPIPGATLLAPAVEYALTWLINFLLGKLGWSENSFKKPTYFLNCIGSYGASAPNRNSDNGPIAS